MRVGDQVLRANARRLLGEIAAFARQYSRMDKRDTWEARFLLARIDSAGHALRTVRQAIGGAR